MSSCPDSLLPTWMISAGLFLLSPYISLLFPRYAWTNITVNPLFFTISSCTDGRSWCFFILLGLFIFIYCFVGKLPPHYYLLLLLLLSMLKLSPYSGVYLTIISQLAPSCRPLATIVSTICLSLILLLCVAALIRTCRANSKPSLKVTVTSDE